GGDLKGIRDHIPYLRDLGVTTLWLTPVVKNGATEDYHGYGATDLYAVDPHLGSLDDYRELGSDLHKQHMKLFFAAVPNHVGPRHPWVAKPPLLTGSTALWKNTWLRIRRSTIPFTEQGRIGARLTRSKCWWTRTQREPCVVTLPMAGLSAFFPT